MSFIEIPNAVAPVSGTTEGTAGDDVAELAQNGGTAFRNSLKIGKTE